MIFRKPHAPPSLLVTSAVTGSRKCVAPSCRRFPILVSNPSVIPGQLPAGVGMRVGCPMSRRCASLNELGYHKLWVWRPVWFTSVLTRSLMTLYLRHISNICGCLAFAALGIDK